MPTTISGREASSSPTSPFTMAQYQQLIGALKEVVFQTDAEGRWTFLNRAWTETTGFSVEESLGVPFLEFVYPDDRQLNAERFRPLIERRKDHCRHVIRYRHKDGGFRWIEVFARLTLDEDGAIVGTSGTLYDLTDQKRSEAACLAARDALEQRVRERTEELAAANARLQADIRRREEAEAALRESEERLRRAFDSSPVGIGLMEPSGRWLRVNAALRETFGYAEAEMLKGSLRDLMSADDWTSVSVHLEAALDGRLTRHDAQIACTHRSGRQVWARIDLALLQADAGQPLHFVVQVEDNTETKLLEDRLAYQAFHDALTNLPNRTLFTNRLQHALSQRRFGGQTVGVLFMDLDNFKVINDSLGHAAGDQLLAAVAGRLKGAVRAGDTLARFGGDEFVALLPSVERPDGAEHIAARLLESLRAPFQILGRDVHVSGSVGIALAGPRDAPTEVIRNADTAMYLSKRNGKGCYQTWHASFGEEALRRLDLENELRAAPERGELALQYQPEVEIATGRTVGVEALVRWDHPARGKLAPSEFIELAEETGMIVPIGAYVLREACRQGAAWMVGVPDSSPFRVSVNLSMKQVLSPGIVDAVEATLRETGLDPQRLILEVTESVVMDEGGVAIQTLRALKRLGVLLAIDDFGTGYSSLAYLKTLPIDYLKIDRKFISSICDRSQDAVIVATMINLAHALGRRVIAEGVETSEQRDLLRELGCDIGQGYHYARPLEPHEVTLGLPMAMA